MEKDLRQRFNPDGSVLRCHQLRMLELLCVFDGICRKHQIPYWLSSGTMLGAVRHKGFIPWDDDVDVEMLREDYLRLLNILPGELPEDIALQTHDTDENYTAVFGKLRDRNSYIAETNDYDRIFKYRGIYIDIFPMEPVPYIFTWISGNMHGQIYVQLKKKIVSDDIIVKRTNRIYSFNSRIGFPVLRFITKLFRVKTIRHSFGTLCYGVRKTDEIFPLTEIEFEGRFFPAPANADMYLKRLFGDYMKLPDLDKITYHLKEIQFNNKKEQL